MRSELSQLRAELRQALRQLEWTEGVLEDYIYRGPRGGDLWPFLKDIKRHRKQRDLLSRGGAGKAARVKDYQEVGED